jgi:hypothetical protein
VKKAARAVSTLLISIVLLAAGASCASTSSSGGDNPGGASGGAKKAANGDDAKDLRNRAQQAVNQAELCLAAVYLASQDTTNINSMASSLEKSRGICKDASSYLASNNAHGFSDQNTELFAAADEAKSATNAGLAYLDTQYPSKLADFQSHAEKAGSDFSQAFEDLNARLSELKVAHVKK